MRICIWFLLLFFSFGLEAHEVQTHPIKKVRQWFNGEKERSSRGFHRFGSLATAGPSGVPHARVIEITGLSKKNGALFFTHKASQTFIDLKENPRAALNIWLPNTLRQATMNGQVFEIPVHEAEKSWKHMSRSMKLMFMASDHESLMESSAPLEAKKKVLEREFPHEIPMPESFVGFRLKPDLITFYEIKPRKFPIKEIATLTDDQWVVSQVEP